MAETRVPHGRMCVECHHPISDDASVCPHCGHDYRPVMLGHAWEEEKTPMPPLGGALIAVSAVTQMVAGLIWLSAVDTSSWSGEDAGNKSVLVALGLSVFVVGLVGIAGGTYAMTRRRLSLALVGGIASVLTGGVLAVDTLSVTIGMVLGLAGVLLIATAGDEFED